MGRRGSNLRSGGGGRSAGPSSAAAAAVDALVGARACIIAYGDSRLSVGSAGGPIGAAALPRSFGSQSMTIKVLAGVHRTGEEGEGGEGDEGAGDASMGETDGT
jgi:hypothetical protein